MITFYTFVLNVFPARSSAEIKFCQKARKGFYYEHETHVLPVSIIQLFN